MPVVTRKAVPTRQPVRTAARVAQRAPARQPARAPARRTATVERESVTAGLKPIRSKLNQGDLYESIAYNINLAALTKKEVKKVIDEYRQHIIRSIMPGSVGQFVDPAFLTVFTKTKAAVKGGVRKPNPFKPGEMYVTKSKPKTTLAKLRAGRKLKAAVIGQ